MFVISPMSGPGERGEPGDLAEPAHPHLDDAELGLGLDPAERQRDAELVVVVRPRRRPCARCGQQSAARMSLVVVFPVAPVIADDAGARAVADRAGDRGERLRARSSGTSAAAAPRASACATKSRAAADRDEQVALLDPARVDLQPGHLVRPGAGVQPPERLDQARARAGSRPGRHALEDLARDLAVVERAPCRPRAPARARRRGRRSRRPPRRGRSPSASSIAARRSSSSLELAARGTGGDLGGDRLRVLGARVVGGEDRPVGERWRRRCPISGRLPRSRSPPAPKTTVSRPSPRPRAARITFSSESGVWA